MNKEELSAMVADILKTMAPEPAVKAAPYHPTAHPAGHGAAG